MRAPNAGQLVSDEVKNPLPGRSGDEAGAAAGNALVPFSWVGTTLAATGLANRLRCREIRPETFTLQLARRQGNLPSEADQSDSLFSV
jgi:hypothetical protein